VPARQAPPATIYNDLATLLPDWEISLKACGQQPTTIDSYLICARNLYSFLVSRGMPTTVASITREHIEHFLATCSNGSSPRPWPSTTDTGLVVPASTATVRPGRFQSCEVAAPGEAAACDASDASGAGERRGQSCIG
jgi:hypothetical protein